MNIETVRVTRNMIDYPKDTYEVVTTSTLTELKELRSQHGEELIMLRRREGWNVWENIGNLRSSMLDMHEGYYDTVIRYRAGSDINRIAHDLVIGGYDSAYAAMVDKCPNDSLYEMFDKLKSWKERIEEITEAVTEGVDCDIWMTAPDPTHIDFVVNAESVSYTTDVWTYRLALRTDNLEEIKWLDKIGKLNK